MGNAWPSGIVTQVVLGHGPCDWQGYYEVHMKLDKSKPFYLRRHVQR
jgi:hypothetical protein